MRYRIFQMESGADLGIFQAEDPDQAILAMYEDAGASTDEGIDPGLRAYEVQDVSLYQSNEGHVYLVRSGDYWAYDVTGAVDRSSFREGASCLEIDDVSRYVAAWNVEKVRAAEITESCIEVAVHRSVEAAGDPAEVSVLVSSPGVAAREYLSDDAPD